MRKLNLDETLALLDELPFGHVAGYDPELRRVYALPLAFVRDGKTILFAIGAGRLAQILGQAATVCFEADLISATLSYRSVVAQGAVRRLQGAEQSWALSQLEQRYGADLALWQPQLQFCYRLEPHELQGRIG